MLERFLKKFTVCPDTGCWLWTAGKESNGYGVFFLAGKLQGAHRVSYEANVGPITDGRHVLHRCDVRNCVNPDHLFLGTHRDNMADMRAKGRAVIIRGEDHGLAKLTEDDVRAIRVDPRSHRTIAPDYGVSAALIHQVKTKKLWRHVK